MPFHFCPQCGTKLQADFKFCPLCGEKLPCPVGESGSVSLMPSLSLSPPKRDEAALKSSLVSSSIWKPTESSAMSRSSPKGRPLPRNMTILFIWSINILCCYYYDSFMYLGVSSYFASEGKSKAKKTKHAPAVEPLQEGEEVTDTTGKKWKLVKLLSQSVTELLYEVGHIGSRSNSKESYDILKLGAKDGRIFNEQNFLQRAAKPASVDKWIKQNKMDFLGIPSCVGFGLHAESYRFLIFPNMGQSLQSAIEKEAELPSEKAVLQLACRIVSRNLMRHTDNQIVYLVGYCHAFRFCPGGQHVEYREASRTPHEGTTEFISMDAHKGAAPSRRSDLQSLGYCMLRWHTGTLPWINMLPITYMVYYTCRCRYAEDVPALLRHCFGRKGVSSAFETYLTKVMSLQYSEEPDYSALKAGLIAALLQLGGSPELPLSF
uniref:VRK serine/threonine kinase 3 n=1 Tax=Gasterosteus aculeatus aculeatus TaxID=481459 RepID=A0AAQ4PAC0_GASAC